jgi:hypothetical protein
MPTSVNAASRGAPDSLTQYRDLFVPAFVQQGVGTMPSNRYRTSSRTGIASTSRRAGEQKRVDFLSGFCGLQTRRSVSARAGPVD